MVQHRTATSRNKPPRPENKSVEGRISPASDNRRYVRANTPAPRPRYVEPQRTYLNHPCWPEMVPLNRTSPPQSTAAGNSAPSRRAPNVDCKARPANVCGQVFELFCCSTTRTHSDTLEGLHTHTQSQPPPSASPRGPHRALPACMPARLHACPLAAPHGDWGHLAAESRTDLRFKSLKVEFL